MIRFSTVAANADILGEDTPMAEPRREPRDAPPGGATPPAGRACEGLRREPDGRPESGTAKPGQDINAPGFIKDEDSGTPE